MAINVSIDEHSRVVSPAGFAEVFRDGQYTFPNQVEFERWLAGNPRLRVFNHPVHGRVLYDYELHSPNLSDCYVGKVTQR